MTNTTLDVAAVTKTLAALRTGNAYDQNKLADKIKSIGTRAKNLDVDMHAAGVAALHVCIMHKDATAAAKLCNALGQHTRSKTMAEWIEGHSDIVLTLKAGVWTAKLCPQDMRRTVEQLEDLAAKAIGKPFWIKPETGTRDFSLHASLAALIKRASKIEGLSSEEKEALATVKVLAAKLAPADEPLNKIDA